MRQLFKISTLLLLIAVFSCSKDNNSQTEDPVVITVTTANFLTSIDENPTNGQIIGAVAGTTNQGSVIFTISEEIPIGSLIINPTSGELSVADATIFDFETNPTITGTVKVANGSVSENSIVTIALNDLFEENIYKGDVLFSSQSDVDVFGANNYTKITGNLFIGNTELQITNLEPISELNEVGGTLVIGTSPTNVDELNITTVGNFLSIQNNMFITDIDALSSLENVGGGIEIQSNSALTNIDGLSNINSLNGSIRILNNSSLNDINGLQNITEGVTEINIVANDVLTNIDGLNSITSTGSVGIGANNILNDINGISNITNIDSNLIIFRNPLIINIMALNNLTTVGGDLGLSENDNLTDLCGLQPLLVGDGLGGVYSVYDNAYNPTQQNIIDGDCSL